MDQMDLVRMAEGDILRAQVAGVTEPEIAYETPQTFDVDRGRGAGFLVTRIRHYKFVLFARRRLALSLKHKAISSHARRWQGLAWAYTKGDAPTRGATFGIRGRLALAQDLCRVNARRLHEKRESFELLSRGSPGSRRRGPSR